MLVWLALAMLATLVILLISGRVSVLVALVLVPTAFAILGGFGASVGQMTLEGLKQVAPAGMMLVFGILFFSLMSDAGLFDPLIRGIIRFAHGDPVRLVTATAVLGLVVSIDGDGSTTYLICCAALLPLYRRMGLDPRILACLLTLACGITNILPWGGPTARIAASLHLDAADIFVPLLPGMFASALAVVALGYMFGRNEQKRLGLDAGDASNRAASLDLAADLSGLDRPTARPRLFWINAALTAAVFAFLVFGDVPLPLLFAVAAMLALVINYPSPDAQRERLEAHASTCFRIIGMVLAAAVLVGVFEGTGMSAALAGAIVAILPPEWGVYLAPITTVISAPMSFFMANTSYIYGVLPVLAETGQHYGIAPVEMSRAMLVGQVVHMLSPMVPSAYLLAGLTGVPFGAHQRFTVGWALAISGVMALVSILVGAVPFRGG